MNVFNKDYLMTAGPTPLPPAVSQVMAEPILYHRAPVFIEIYERVLERLKMVFQTESDVLVFASSGTGGMESAVANLIAPGDKVLVASCGKFGQRWAELCDVYGADLYHHDGEWGARIEPDELERALQGAGDGVRTVFTTHSETSTGVVNDIAALTEVAHRHGALIAVDAVSSLGVIDLQTDAWGVDVVASGSQKALMCPPGLGFAAVSENALAAAGEARARGARSYYFDWEKTAKGQRKSPADSPFTPAVTLFRALDVALDMIDRETLAGVFERHAVLGRAAREAVKAQSLELFGPEDENANVVTAVKVPEGVDGAAVPKLMRDRYRVTIAGGQGHLKGKIVRVAHCGYYGAFDVLSTAAALEMALSELGADVNLGSGVAAAQQVFLEAGVPAAQPVENLGVADNSNYKVLVKEKIADTGVSLLREHFDVDVQIEMPDDELREAIAGYEGIVIRSATKMTADLIERADRLKVIGRAGIGVDNVDVPAATKHGIIVANAPESNTVAAAEHTIALMLSQARNVPQAHASLKGGKWERSKFGGVEVYEKTLGILGFGRIGQLVAQRARAFGMNVIAYDPFVSAERFRELGVGHAADVSDIYAQADVITIHLPRTPETTNFLNADAFAQMKDGVRIVNCARGELLDLGALKDAVESGKVAGAGLDVFPEEPMTEHPVFSLENVVVTPHLGASTTEAQDRAGVITAEQVVAALTGGLVTNAVNIPTVRGEDLAVLEPYMPLATQLGRLAMSLAARTSVDRIEISFVGRLADFDTRLVTLSVLNGALAGRIEENVNLVNASTIAEDRGIGVVETKEHESRDYANLLSVAVTADGERVEVAGTTFGPRHVPHLVSAYGQSFNIELAQHMVIFRYSDLPGMIGKIGTVLGEHGINIASTAVGREPDHEPGRPAGGGSGRLAVMVVTTDSPVPDETLDAIVSLEGFQDGRAVTL